MEDVLAGTQVSRNRPLSGLREGRARRTDVNPA
jgi:hypothetical protein